MKHPLIIHEPAVKIAVARRDAGKVFRLERTFVNQLLPHSVVGRKVDVFEQLAIQHLVNDTAWTAALHIYLILLLCSGSDTNGYCRNCNKSFSHNYNV